MIRNDTDIPFQLLVNVGEEYLTGEWRSVEPPLFKYEIVEKNHEMRQEFWGGYSRHNELYREVYTRDGEFVREEFVVANSAIMMYRPFLTGPDGKGTCGEDDHSRYDR